MTFTLWSLIIGALFIVMGLSGTVLKRLPLTTSMLYMLVGFVLGPIGVGLFTINALEESALLERIAEIAVLISLFTAGLKLRVPLSDGRWFIPLRLAFVSMMITVGLITLVGVWLLNLPLGAAVLLGAILAPTDPVLASDVQVERPTDRDRLRFGLTGEAGFNDGTAFPFVMLGLGLLGLHELGFGDSTLPLRWLVIDVVWAIVGGIAIGWGLGFIISKMVLYLRKEYKEAVGLDEFFALGLIALSYGAALLCLTYGFLAVFAAGLALRRIEMDAEAADETSEAPIDVQAQALNGQAEEIATDAKRAPAYMAQAVLSFNEQLEHIGEVGLVILIGGMLASYFYPPVEALWFIPLLFFVIRPLSVIGGLIGSETSNTQRGLISWFGLRGIGSIYYLMYAIEHGVPDDIATRLINIVLTVIAASIIIHGISVTPLMSRYHKQQKEEHAAQATEGGSVSTSL